MCAISNVQWKRRDILRLPKFPRWRHCLKKCYLLSSSIFFWFTPLTRSPLPFGQVAGINEDPWTSNFAPLLPNEHTASTTGTALASSPPSLSPFLFFLFLLASSVLLPAAHRHDTFCNNTSSLSLSLSLPTTGLFLFGARPFAWPGVIFPCLHTLLNKSKLFGGSARIKHGICLLWPDIYLSLMWQV